ATDWSFFSVTERTTVIRNDWGVDGQDYGFWPMLFGGFFLYAAYYGCDQSQTQRILSAQSDAASQRVLLLNGLLRFPLVLSYCLLGLGLAAFAAQNSSFVTNLPLTGAGEPNFNLAFPMYVLDNFAPGFVGLVMVGLLAAAMSSIDSAINSLSAATMEDFVRPRLQLTDRQVLRWSRGFTLFWGVACIVFSFQVERIAPTILEAVNKVGSMFNGPLLALFVTALLLRNVPQRFALSGFVLGLLTNLGLALGAPQVSWLWWNAAGFLVAMLWVGIAMSLSRVEISVSRYQYPQLKMSIGALGMMAAVILVFSFVLQSF
ncbi:MAG: sodium:solute symporter, partial [Pseudomonadota bacterium]|nr:sodium:solute symporter [Pseudomonadota bacterium]